MLIDLARDCPIIKLSFAGVPPSFNEPSTVSVGAFKYPLPGFKTSTSVTLPPAPNFVIALAPLPPPPHPAQAGCTTPPAAAPAPRFWTMNQSLG